MNKYFYDGLLCGLFNCKDSNPYKFGSSAYWDWQHGLYQGMNEFLDNLQSIINGLA